MSTPCVVDGYIYGVCARGELRCLKADLSSEAILDVQATSNLGSVLKQLRELKKSGREHVDYRLSGRINVDGFGSIPFDRRGDVQIPRADPLPGVPAAPRQERI